MAWEWLQEPVTVAEPCGHDLEKSDDPDFIDYYFEAEGRLPDRYFTPGVPNLWAVARTSFSIRAPFCCAARRNPSPDCCNAAATCAF
ncbi:hypothetical protein QWZ10_21415 [Paracoccus cavernae]|uniref:Uncharacterized protein n=1 Tax=Paracoccus cavernae TaxID=1571207 RepID=A0ABT8DBE1_9RHOB|nr:hypothetical protein [Paracoccus cavernae]